MIIERIKNMLAKLIQFFIIATILQAYAIYIFFWIIVEVLGRDKFGER
jgi:hypothetical protein